MSDVVRSLAELESLYGDVSQVALDKVTDRITPGQRAYIEAAPFVLVASVGADGVDCSPRGDPAGWVRVVDERTVQLPDRRGNNRLDTLRNIVADGRIALLFLVPGVGTTLRINGTAVLRTDDALRASFAMDSKLPATVIQVAVREVYTQCPKALIRSALWEPDAFRDPADLPSVGRIMSEISDGVFDGDAYDRAYPRRIVDTIY